MSEMSFLSVINNNKGVLVPNTPIKEIKEESISNNILQ